MEEEKEKLGAFGIIERMGSKNLWVYLGPAYRNKDGSINVKCHCFPVALFKSDTLTINIREMKPKETNEAEAPF